MLRRLHIENIAVIRQADLSFGEGFSVLTGETGAGKSIIIDSINLLAGNRASRDLVRSGEKSATVCAMFDSLSQKTVQALSEIGITCDDGCVLLEKISMRTAKAVPVSTADLSHRGCSGRQESY